MFDIWKSFNVELLIVNIVQKSRDIVSLWITACIDILKHIALFIEQ